MKVTPHVRKVLAPEEKRRMLAIAGAADNISNLCRQLMIPRSTYYSIRKAYRLRGDEGLEARARRPPRMPNAFSMEVVERIMEMTRRFSSYSGPRISRKLKEAGISVSASGIYKVWRRQGWTRNRRQERSRGI